MSEFLNGVGDRLYAYAPSQNLPLADGGGFLDEGG
jgi:hypothetical protein